MNGAWYLALSNLGPLGMEQQHQARLQLMKLALFSAEIKPHLEAFFEGVFKGRGRGGNTRIPNRSNPHRSGMPAEAAGNADVGLLQSFFKEFANWHGLSTLPPASGAFGAAAIS